MVKLRKEIVKINIASISEGSSKETENNFFFHVTSFRKAIDDRKTISESGHNPLLNKDEDINL